MTTRSFSLIAFLGFGLVFNLSSFCAAQSPGETPKRPPAIIIKNQLTGEDIFSRLDPQAQEVVRIAVGGGPFPDEPVAKRKAFDQLFANLSGTPETILSTEDQQLTVANQAVPLRIYRPRSGTLPVLVYYHGGGFNKGSLQSHDATLRSLANKAGCLIVAVDYHLAPEHQYPTQINEAYATLQWVVAHATQLGADATRIAVGGDSVGGNLAAVTALRARDEGSPKLIYQLLFYPVTDVTLSSRSWREMANGPWLTKAGEHEGFTRLYLPANMDPRQAYVSPLFAANLKGLPAAFIADAEYDPYRDEGQAYGRKLKEAGTVVTSKVYPGMIHDFALMIGRVDAGRQLLQDAADALNVAFRR